VHVEASNAHDLPRHLIYPVHSCLAAAPVHQAGTWSLNVACVRTLLGSHSCTESRHQNPKPKPSAGVHAGMWVQAGGTGCRHHTWSPGSAPHRFAEASPGQLARLFTWSPGLTPHCAAKASPGQLQSVQCVFNLSKVRVAGIILVHPQLL